MSSTRRPTSPSLVDATISAGAPPIASNRTSAFWRRASSMTVWRTPQGPASLPATPTERATVSTRARAPASKAASSARRCPKAATPTLRIAIATIGPTTFAVSDRRRTRRTNPSLGSPSVPMRHRPRTGRAVETTRGQWRTRHGPRTGGGRQTFALLVRRRRTRGMRRRTGKNDARRGARTRGAESVRSVDFDEDALAGAFLGGLDRCFFHAGRDVGEPFRPTRVGEDLRAFLDVREAIVEQREDIGGDLFAEPVAGAQILVDPHLHRWSSPRGIAADETKSRNVVSSRLEFITVRSEKSSPRERRVKSVV